MSHTNSGCPLCQAHGYALGGIVARETSTGEFSGSTSSIGANHDGLTFSTGSIHGSSSSTSLLAQQLACPGPIAVEPGNPYVMTMMMSFFMVISGYMLPLVVEVLGEGGVSTDGLLGSSISSLDSLVSIAPSIVMALGFTSLGWSAFKAITHSTSQEDTEEYNNQLKIDEAVGSIYARLRYCAADHIVFDTTTGKSCQPDAEGLRRMIFAIAAA